MAQYWYRDTITNTPIYPVHLEKQRHFTSQYPLPGALTMCGLKVGDDWEDFNSIETTHETCSQLVFNVKQPEPPGPKITIEDPQTPEELEKITQDFLAALDAAKEAASGKNPEYSYSGLENAFEAWKVAQAKSGEVAVEAIAELTK